MDRRPSHVVYRVHYTYFDQTINKSAKWEQRHKDFQTKEEARAYVKKIDWNVAVKNINIQPILNEDNI